MFFGAHYTELAIAVDDIAERIRTLDVPAPGTYKEFAKLSSIKKVDGVPSSAEMIELLTKSHEQVIRTARKVLKVKGCPRGRRINGIIGFRSYAYSCEENMDAPSIKKSFSGPK